MKKSPVSAKARKLLERVIRHIEAEPRRLDMDIWGHKETSEDSSDPPCGTVGCIAGWVAMFADPATMNAKGMRFRSKMNKAPKLAAGLLGCEFTPGTMENNYTPHGELFLVDDWPEKYQRRYWNANDAIDGTEPESKAEKAAYKRRAAATIARIRYFMRTGK